MNTFKVDIEGVKEVKTLLSNMPDVLFKGTRTIFQKAAFSAEKKIKQNATTSIMVRTGLLKRSIGQEVSGNTLGNLKASVYAAGKVSGSTIIYAPIHEWGGIIKAKNAYKNVPGGPYLNIPAPANKTAAGVMRMTPRMVFDQGGFIAGRAVYLDGQPMFYLVKSVTIKARLGMRDAAADEIPTILSALKDLDLEG